MADSFAGRAPSVLAYESTLRATRHPPRSLSTKISTSSIAVFIVAIQGCTGRGDSSSSAATSSSSSAATSSSAPSSLPVPLLPTAIAPAAPSTEDLALEASCKQCLGTNCDVAMAGACRALAALAKKGVRRKQDPLAAIAYERQACTGKDAVACDELGTMTLAGVGVVRDVAAAVKLFQTACTLGAGAGCYHLGILHRQGVDVPRDLAKAKSEFATARDAYEYMCRVGEQPGCAGLANLEEGEYDRPPDRESARANFKRCCDHGSQECCANLAMRMDASKPDEKAKMVQLFTSGCEKKDGLSCTMLSALKMDASDASDANVGEALGLLRSACDAGSMDACLMLGRMKLAKDRVGYDPNEGLALEDRACVAGLGAACHAEGMLALEAGDIGHERARFLFGRACDMGMGEACGVLGAAYGGALKDGEIDKHKELELYRRGCQLSNADACLGLTSKGEPIPEGLPKALYVRMCKQGDKPSCERAK